MTTKTKRTKQDFVKQGKRNKVRGSDFERRVRKDLQSKEWIVSKWMNNIEFYEDMQPFDSHVAPIKGKLIPAKHKFCGIGRPMAIGTGFPDFVAFRISNSIKPHNYCEVIGVEAKSNGYLDKTEKQKCKWLLQNNIFSKILIASRYKEKNRVKIKYEEFK